MASQTTSSFKSLPWTQAKVKVDECEEQQKEDSVGLKHTLSSWSQYPKLHREVCIPYAINQSHLKPSWLCNNPESWYSKAHKVSEKLEFGLLQWNWRKQSFSREQEPFRIGAFGKNSIPNSIILTEQTEYNLIFKRHTFGRPHTGAYLKAAYSSKGKSSTMKAELGVEGYPSCHYNLWSISHVHFLLT